MYKVFYLFFCVVHLLGLRRGGGRWWWQPISFPYASVRMFSHGFFGAVLSGPFPVLSFLKVCHLGAWWFRGIPGGLLSLPVILWVTFSLSAVASPSPVLGGGGRENILLAFIIMHSCNPNDRFDLWISSHCWAKIYLCFRRLQRSKLCWLGRLKQFYFSY